MAAADIAQNGLGAAYNGTYASKILLEPMFHSDDIMRNYTIYPNVKYKQNILMAPSLKSITALNSGCVANTCVGTKFTVTQKTRPLVVAKLEEFFREKLVTVHSQRLIDELFVFIYNGSRAEAMSGYNDDLVMSYGMGLWIRETALRLRTEGINLQKKAMDSITSNQGVYTPKNNQNDSWTMEVNKEQESLDWLL